MKDKVIAGHEEIAKQMSERHLDRSHFDSVMWSLGKAAAHLEERIKVLPKVNEDGSSECSFAAILYRDKDEAAKVVSEKLKDIDQEIPLLEKAIARKLHELNTINATKGKLHGKQSIEEYERAFSALHRGYQELIKRRTALINLIESTQKLLKKAEVIVFPGEKKEKKFQPRMALGSSALRKSAYTSLYPGPKPEPLESPQPPTSKKNDLAPLRPVPGRLTPWPKRNGKTQSS